MSESKAVTATNADMRAYPLCQNCGKRPATQNWIGIGSTPDYVHGNFARWCELCCVEAQLEYARKAAERIPELEKRLEFLRTDDSILEQYGEAFEELAKDKERK